MRARGFSCNCSLEVFYGGLGINVKLKISSSQNCFLLSIKKGTDEQLLGSGSVAQYHNVLNICVLRLWF